MTSTERLAYRIVRLASILVPFGRRADFAREWNAELSARFHPHAREPRPGSLARLVLVYRSLLSVIDAAHLRSRELTLDSILKDLRFALRSLARRPAFTAITLLTLGLGIGANTAIFTVVNAVLLRPLPYPEPDELVMVWENDHVRGWERMPASAEDFLSWRSEVESLEALSAGANAAYSLTSEGEPEQVQGFAVTADFFRVFDVPPLYGVPFGIDSNVEGAHHKAVLSHALWQRRYGADPGIVGRTIDVNGAPFEVVAVMPRGFQFPSAAQMWTPLVFSEAQLQDRNWHFLLSVGRLADGTAIAEAGAELQTIAARLTQEFPESNGDSGIDVRPLHAEMTNQLRGMLLVLLGAVGFVLLIACANVANLLLVRAAGRVRELSVRTALGAGRVRLVRQLLTESVLLAGGGGVLGVGVAYLGLDVLLALNPLTAPGGAPIRIDGWVLAATGAAALATGVAFGLAPAVATWRTDVQEALKDGRSQAGGGGKRMRSLLVVAEMAMALVLVTGAGLMMQSVRRLLDVDVGVDVENVLLAQFTLPAAAYPDSERQRLFYDQLLERARAIPGVTDAALSTVVPPQSGGQFHVRIEGVHEAWTMDLPVARNRSVSANYFEAMGIPLVRGRFFTPDDGPEAPQVLVVDQAFVDEHFPDVDPIGRQMRTLLDTPREIVGVVGNVANTGLANEAGPTTYAPYAQHVFGNTQTLVLRTGPDPATLLQPTQAAVWELDPSLPLVNVGTLVERLSGSVSQPRFNSALLSLFALLALTLAGVGIYGVMAYTVSERTGELGLRMALGASGSSVRTLVVRKALALTTAGIVIGLAASLGLTRVISSYLFGIQPTDPITFATVALILCAVALSASYIPARRASRLDPLRALRQE